MPRISRTTVFISYSSADSNTVDVIDRDLGALGINIVRDIRDAHNYCSIKQYMRRIRREDYALIFISDAFLRSENCLYEILEFLKDDNYAERIVPVVPANQLGHLFSTEAQLYYARYWAEKFANLEQTAKSLSTDEMVGISERFRLIRNIRTNIGQFMEIIRDIKLVPFEQLKMTSYTSLLERLGHDDADVLVELLRISSLKDSEEQDIAQQAFLKQQPRHFLANCIFGDIALKNGQFKKALGYYNVAMSMNNSDAVLLNDRGTTFYKLQKYHEAIADYSQAIELEPESAAAYYGRGCALDELEEYEAAIKDYGQAIERKPESDEIFNNRGATYFKLKMYREAVLDYDRALELRPDNRAASLNRQAALSLLQGGEKSAVGVEGALPQSQAELKVPILVPGLARTSENPMLQALLGRLQLALLQAQYGTSDEPRFQQYYNYANECADAGRYQEAILNYDRALECNPGLYEAYFNRGVTRAQIGKYEEALDDYKRAMEINPADFELYYAQANSYKKMKKYENALESYGKALALNPMAWQALENRANTYAELGRNREAVDDYKRLQKIHPHHRTEIILSMLESRGK